jgi:esterase/lipase superfamily enzyme
MMGSVLALAVLAIAGTWFYQLYFSSTSYALQRAEAFAFRRMVIAQLEDQGSYRFFFVTNRQQAVESGPVEERFSAGRDAVLSFGSFDISIEPSLGLGMIINPTEWFQNEELRLKAVRDLEQEQFLAQLRQVVEASPERSLLVVVHGFREAFPSALRKTAFLGHVLDINTPILVFDWPGNQGSSASGYRRASELATASAAELAATLELIIREIGPARLSVIANSMGAQVVVDAFRALYRDTDLGADGPRLQNVILTAPDVDYAGFNEEFRQALGALSRHTIVYVSSNDRALVASRLLNRGRRLGQSSLRASDMDRSVRVVDHDPNSDEVTVVDVTAVNRTRNFHNFSLETPEFYDDLYLRLSNSRVPRSRLIYAVEGPNGTIYWVLTRGR